MKNTKVVIMGVTGIIAVIAIVAILLMNLGPSAGAEEVFEAQIAAIKGDNSKVEKLGLETNYYEESLTVFADSGLNINEHQNNAAKKALEDFTYKVVEVNEIDDTTYQVIYEIDSYPIVDLLLTYQENPDEYLSAEELEAYNSRNYESEAYQSGTRKLMDAYYAGLSDVKPVRVKSSLTYVYSEDEKAYVLEDEAYFADLVKTILGVSNIQKETVE